MKKIVLSVIAVFSLVAPAFTLNRTVATCPVKMPETLLSLYRQSDAIYIGRYGGSEEGAVTREDDYTIVEIKKHFDISSVLKGKPVKTFTLLDSDYRHTAAKAVVDNAEQVGEGDETSADEVNETDEVPEAEANVIDLPLPETDIDDEDEVTKSLQPGDRVLLFLRADEDEGKELVLTDYSDGLKNLTASDLAVYETRIKELAAILSAEKPDIEKVTEWLVRCAEDPATRWEGAYELERSFNAVEYKAQRDAARAERIARGEKAEDDDGDDYFNDGLDTGRTMAFAKTLNDYQKQTLANVLLNSEFQAPRQNGRMVPIRGDRELMSLVTRWADTRIAELYLNRLRSGAYSAPENSDLMTRIASILGDEQLTAIARKYDEVHYEPENDEADEDDLIVIADPATGDDDEAVDPDAKDEVSPAPATGPEATEAERADSVDDDTAKKPVLTYKLLCGALTAKFLARADEIIANPGARGQ